MSTHRRRGFALVAEHLEDRSVPSGFGPVSLPSLTLAFRPAANLAQDVVSPGDLGGPATALSTIARAPALSAGGAVATAPALAPIGVSLGLQAAGPGAPDADVAGVLTSDVAGVLTSIDPGEVIPTGAGPGPVVPAVGGIRAAVVGAVDDVGDLLDGVLATVSAGGDRAGPSIGGGSGLGSTGIASSNASIALTLPGLSVDVDLGLPLPGSTGTLPVPSLPPAPTSPTAPGDPVGTLVSLPPLGGNPATNPPTSPTEPGGRTSGTPASPISVGGAAAMPQPTPASPGSVTLPAASPPAPTGSASGDAVPADPTAAAPPAVALASNAGPLASAGAAGDSAREAESSATSPSGPVATSGPTGGVGVAAAGGQAPREGAAILADSSSAAVDLAAGRTTPAELRPGDMESLERAFARLMRQLDGTDGDLAAWLTRIDLLEILAAAGMAALACEVLRRWERRRQRAIPGVQVGSAGRPWPFYRPNASPFGRPGPGRSAGRPALV